MSPRHRKRSGSFLVMLVVMLGLVGASFAFYAAVTGSAPTTEEITATSTPPRIGMMPSATPSVTKPTSPTSSAPSTPKPKPTRDAPSSGTVAKPTIVQKPIPFGAMRRTETVAYAKRHYGIATWHLEHPHVIVEHDTAGTSFQSAYNSFAANSPDLGELPGTCAHFVIDTDGTIYQLVPLNTICRHTVGLNWTAIGIEAVGTSDAQILHDRAQLDASLLLTLWLMQRYGISLANVIGHNESLSSPYHREDVASWRCQTHSDWTHTNMIAYRRLLANLARREGVQISTKGSEGSSDAQGC